MKMPTTSLITLLQNSGALILHLGQTGHFSSRVGNGGNGIYVLQYLLQKTKNKMGEARFLKYIKIECLNLARTCV